MLEDEARDALLTEIRAQANAADGAVELRLLAEAFALVTGNVAAPGLSAERFAEVLRSKS